MPDSIETEHKTTFELNEKFENFASLEKKIEQYERELCCTVLRLEKAVSKKEIAADRSGKNPLSSTTN